MGFITVWLTSSDCVDAFVRVSALGSVVVEGSSASATRLSSLH